MSEPARTHAWRSLLESGNRNRADAPVFFLAAAILGFSLLYLLVLGLAGADIAAALPLLVAAIGAGTLALWGWHRDRLAAFGAYEQQTRAEMHNRRLRRQLVELHHAREALADPTDVPTMIVQIATGLLEAERGLLLVPQSSTEATGQDAESAAAAWEVLATLGFSETAARSDAVQQVARDALGGDHPVRIDEAALARLPRSEPAIRNLVGVPIYVRNHLHGVVVCANRAGGFADYDDDVLLALGDQAGAVLENGRMQSELRDSYVAVVRMLAETIRVKDPSLHSHCGEVSDYVVAVAQRLQLDGERRERLRFGSLLHDVGKIAISERILLKPGPLDADEWREIRTHPLVGAQLLREVDALAPLADAVLHHHERWDGKGYPDGLQGEAIPLEARIIAVADAFSAMTADRPYRQPRTIDDALAELERSAGSAFDPHVVEIFAAEVRRRPPERTIQPVGAALSELNAAGRTAPSSLSTPAAAAPDAL